MAGGIKIIRAIPGSTHLVPILRDFCKAEGTVTSLNDSLLYTVRQLVEEDWPVEVAPFGQIVRQYLALCGEPALFIAPTGHARAAIAHACQSLNDASPFFRSSKFTGTHDALARTIDDLADYGIGREELDSLAERASPRLRSKLESLAQLVGETERVMASFGRQSSSEQLCTCLASVPERDGSLERLLVFSGSDIPPLKLHWLQWAAKHGTSITVVLDRHAAEAPIFQSADVAAMALGGPGTTFGEGNRLLNNLFGAEALGGAPVRIEVASAADPLAEAEWAVRGCLSAERPAIYCRDLESYAPLIESAARRLDLPVRVFRRAPLLTNSFARLTLCVIEFCAGKDVRALEPILRSSYLNLDSRQLSGVTGAIREAYKTRALAWPQLESYATAAKEDLPWLMPLLEWRRRALAGPLTAREWMGLLNDLIRADESLPWSTAVPGDRLMRERDIRARNQMEKVLGDAFSVLNLADPRPLNLREIAALCRKLWEEADVSIPASDIGVTVTNEADMIGEADALFVLGMLEGVFPRRRSEDPVLTDAERAEISSLFGIALPSSHDKSRAERDEFYRVCAAAGNRLVFSYPTTDDQRDNIPAFYLEEVRRAAGEENFASTGYPRPMLAPKLEDCGNDIDRSLRVTMDSPREYAMANALSTLPGRMAVAPEPDAAFTPGELRDALQCPFQYVARHKLKLTPKRQQARWASLRRLPETGDLVVKSDAAAAEAALLGALEAKLDEHYGEMPDWEVQLLRSGGRRLISEWVRREFKARDKWPKADGSVKRHARFGDELRDKMPGGLKLRGTVAAKSRLGSYNIGHLYTSQAPDDAELDDRDRLYYGLHLLALFNEGSDMGLEIESMAGKRILLVLGRAPGTFLPGDAHEGLRVIDLATNDDTSIARKEFFEGVKDLIKDAMANIREGEILPKRGEHCTWCDYGELCRRSYYFSEEDSPFGVDLVIDEL